MNETPKPIVSILLICAGIVLNTVMFVITIPLMIWQIRRINWTLYFWRIASMMSQIGNAIHSAVFNTWFWEEDGYQSGNIDESISGVTGKNYRSGKLRRLGKVLRKILDKLDHNHSIEAVEDDESFDNGFYLNRQT